ncbi:MAG TPA: PAS domain-containing protein, partial [Terriglobia bacterium]|nr:PAS domain-containing protein [Terriglobia bacterium]
MSKQAELIEDLVDSSDAAIYLKDGQGRFIMVNRKVAELAKMSKEDLIGKTDFDILPKDQADRVRSADQKVTRSGAAVDFTETL